MQDVLKVEPSSDRAALKSSHAELLKRIDYLADLEADWDGYGARRVSRMAIKGCLHLLSTIDRRFYSQAGEPFVAPMADGGLQLEWDRVFEKELILVIPPDGTSIRFLLTSFDETGNAKDHEGVLSEESRIYEWLSSALS